MREMEKEGITAPSGLVDRVAKAIFAGMYPGYPASAFDDAAPLVKDVMRAHARAAIEAMREPTEAMCFVDGPGDQHNYRDAQYRAIWKKMIEAALSERSEAERSS
jgi:hypothetical protein